jgi:cysteinyl-tRNA synthetase
MIRLFDSFTRRKVDLEPRVAGEIGMYLCGPTVQNSPHVGHARSAVAFDVVRRYLAASGFHVTYVRNVTDIDDKIIERARELGRTPVEVAAQYSKEYDDAVTALGVMPPSIKPRVTEHIPEIVQLVERLVASGAAYPVDGDVYYRVASFQDYGKLSGQPQGELLAGARVEVDVRKESPLDFALWKAAKPGEPSWPSPWGQGRPGWHIECSAMCAKHLGESFEIHAGGKDLVFPHHENEIAQSQAAFGPGTFAHYWMHNGFVNLNDVKMSKSLGNVFLVSELLERNAGEAIRLYLLQTHYRSPISFEVIGDKHPVFPGVDEAERRLEYLYLTLTRLDDLGELPSAAGVAIVPEAERFLGALRAGMDDDFNTAVALAEISEAARLANKLLDEPKGMAKDVRRATLARLRADLRTGGAALGLLQDTPAVFLDGRRTRLASARGIDPSAVTARITEREDARRSKNYARADEIRNDLRGQGIEIMDGPRGSSWRIVDSL